MSIGFTGIINHKSLILSNLTLSKLAFFRGFYYGQHRLHFGRRFVPLLCFLALRQDATPGIEAIAVIEDAHAAQRYKHRRLAIDIQRTRKAAIVTAVTQLIIHNEAMRLPFGQTAHCWCGMQVGKYSTKRCMIGHREREIGAQVSQDARAHGIWSRHSDVITISVKTLFNVLGNKGLLLQVLVAPGRQLLGIAHRACQRHRVPAHAVTLQQHLGSSDEPGATLRSREQRHKGIRILLACAREQSDRMGPMMAHVSTACKYQFLDTSCRKSPMKSGKNIVISLP